MSLADLPWEIIEIVILQNSLSFKDVKNLLGALFSHSSENIKDRYSNMKLFWEKKFRLLHPLLFPFVQGHDEIGWWDSLEEWDRIEEKVLQEIPNIRRDCFNDILYRLDERKDLFISWLLESDPFDRRYICDHDFRSTNGIQASILSETTLSVNGEIPDKDLIRIQAFEIRPLSCENMAADKDCLFFPVPSFSNDIFRNLLDMCSGISQREWIGDVLKSLDRVEFNERSLQQFIRISCVHVQKILSCDEAVRAFNADNTEEDLNLLLAIVGSCFPSFVQLKLRILSAANLFIGIIKGKLRRLSVTDQVEATLEELNFFWRTPEGESLLLFDTLLADLRIIWQHDILEKPVVPFPVFSFFVICKLMKLPVTFSNYIFHFDNTSQAELLLVSVLISNETLGCCVPIKLSNGLGSLKWLEHTKDILLPSYVSNFYDISSGGVLVRVQETSLVEQLGKWLTDIRKQKKLRHIKGHHTTGLMYHHELCLKLRPNMPSIAENYLSWLSETGNPMNVQVLEQDHLPKRIKKSAALACSPLAQSQIGTSLLPIGSIVKYSVDTGNCDLHGVVIKRETKQCNALLPEWCITYDILPLRSSTLQTHAPRGINVITSLTWPPDLSDDLLHEVDNSVWLFFDRTGGHFFHPHSDLAMLYSADIKL